METLKVIFCGASQLGKTSLIKYMKTGQLPHIQSESTIGCEAHTYYIRRNNQRRKVVIWDMAGDPRYYGLRERYMRGARAAILFLSFDEEINQQWRDYIRNVLGNVPIIEIRHESSTLFPPIGAQKWERMKATFENEMLRLFP